MKKEKSRSLAWLYKELNKEAKAWWYYKKLRKMGENEQARKLERASILRSVQVIRDAKLIIIGNTGTVTVHLSDDEYLKTYDPDFYLQVMPECVPVVDLRGNAAKEIARAYMFAVHGPMVSIERGEEKEKYGALDYAPLHIYLGIAESLGIPVRWGHMSDKRQSALELAKKVFPVKRMITLINQASEE